MVESEKRRLIDYNFEDCAALESISSALALWVQKPNIFTDADFVDVPKTPSTERGKELFQCLNSVLKSAQLIYANKKISLHLLTIRIAMRAAKSHKKKPPICKGCHLTVAELSVLRANGNALITVTARVFCKKQKRRQNTRF